MLSWYCNRCNLFSEVLTIASLNPLQRYLKIRHPSSPILKPLQKLLHKYLLHPNKHPLTILPLKYLFKLHILPLILRPYKIFPNTLINQLKRIKLNPIILITLKLYIFFLDIIL